MAWITWSSGISKVWRGGCFPRVRASLGFVATELRRQKTWSSQAYDLRHYRNRLGVEVDLVAELSGGRVIGIEVKASTSFNGNQFSGLRVLREALGKRFVMGIVLNTGRQGFRLGDRLYGLPIDALWRLASPSASDPDATMGV